MPGQLGLEFMADAFERTGHADQFGSNILLLINPVFLVRQQGLLPAARDRPPATRRHKMYS